MSSKSTVSLLAAGVVFCFLGSPARPALGQESLEVDEGILVTLHNGDSNGNGNVDLSDAVHLLAWLYLGGPAPVPLVCGSELSPVLNGDVNGDRAVDLSDAVSLLGWLYAGGPPPAPACGGALGLGGSTASPNIVLQWNEIASVALVDLAKRLAAQAIPIYAMAQAAVFDAVNVIDGRYQPFAVAAHAAPGASADAAVATAAHHVLVGRLPAQQAALDASYAASLASIPDGDSKANGIALGAEVAAGLLAQRADDGYGANIPYTAPPGPGVWEPTPPNFPAPVAVWLASMRPFSLERPSQFRPAGPPALDSERYAADFNEVKVLGAKNSTVRTPRQTEIASFWLEHALVQYNRSWRKICLERGLTLADSARFLAMVEIGGADSLIACWDSKYSFNFWRPITAIRRADTDGNDATTTDATWEPLAVTPGHPDYTSGHSAFSGCVAKMAAGFFGTDKVRFTMDSLSSGTTHYYARFSQVPREMIGARVWAGIHFRTANIDGVNLGKKVARQILQHHFRRVGEEEEEDEGDDDGDE